MKLNRKWLLVIALVLSMTMAISGTLAYLTDSDADYNVMTLGKVEIEQHEYERAVNADGTYKTDTIDNQNSYVLKDFSQGKPLVPTTEIDADGNPINFGAGDYDDTTVRMSQVYSYGGMQVFESENAQDKFVTVENTGRTDAYVRTIVALEAGSVSAEEWGNLIRTSHHFTWDVPEEKGIVNIDGNNYMIVEFVYKGWEQNRHVGGVLPAGDTTYPNLSQVYMTAKATNEDVEALDGNGNGLYDIMVLSQAVQADGFNDAATALKAGFGEVTAANVQKWFGDVKYEGGEEPKNGDDPSVTYPAPEEAVEVATVDALKEAIAKGSSIIKLADGEWDIPSECAGRTLSLYGSKNAVLKLTNEGEDGCDYGFGSAGSGVGNITFNGLTIDTTGNNGNYKGYAYMGGIFNDCTFVGAYSLNNANTFEFNYCDFDFKNGYFWTWGAENATFNNCDFNGNSKCILAHGWASTNITINNCKFAATEKGYTGSGDNTACVEIDPAGTNTYTINFTGTNTKTESYSGWTRVKDESTGHTITGLE